MVLTLVSPISGESKSKCLHSNPTVNRARINVDFLDFTVWQSLFNLCSCIIFARTPGTKTFVLLDFFTKHFAQTTDAASYSMLSAHIQHSFTKLNMVM